MTTFDLTAMATAPRPLARTRTALHLLIGTLAVVLAALASLYWLIGIDRTLDIQSTIFALRFPSPTGAAAIPAIDYDRGLFHGHSVAFYGHVLFSPLALVLGALQLSRRLRESSPAWHRMIGKAYLLSVAIGIPCGIRLGEFEWGGLTATIGFTGMGAATLVCAALAYAAIRSGDVPGHRAWMLRSYAVLWSGSALFRLMIFFFIPVVARDPMPQGFREPYTAFIFLSWVIGFVAADVWLHLTRERATRA